MANAPLTPEPSPRTKDDDALILQMDRERRQRREDVRRSFPWTQMYPEHISTPVLLDEECQGAKRQCIRDDSKLIISYRRGVSSYTLQPRNLNATFQNCDSPRLNTHYCDCELPVPVSP